VSRFGMMAGNFAQHAFVDAAQPENPYRNSLTCINSTYNRRCFNDGYHIGHHVKATRHWTEMPADFIANRERYAQEDAIVIGVTTRMLVLAIFRVLSASPISPASSAGRTPSMPK